jgi:hypothetical protein
MDVCSIYYPRMAWTNVRWMSDLTMDVAKLGSNIRLGKSEIGRTTCPRNGSLLWTRFSQRSSSITSKSWSLQTDFLASAWELYSGPISMLSYAQDLFYSREQAIRKCDSVTTHFLRCNVKFQYFSNFVFPLDSLSSKLQLCYRLFFIGFIVELKFQFFSNWLKMTFRFVCFHHGIYLCS